MPVIEGTGSAHAPRSIRWWHGCLLMGKAALGARVDTVFPWRCPGGISARDTLGSLLSLQVGTAEDVCSRTTEGARIETLSRGLAEPSRPRPSSGVGFLPSLGADRTPHS